MDAQFGDGPNLFAHVKQVPGVVLHVDDQRVDPVVSASWTSWQNFRVPKAQALTHIARTGAGSGAAIAAARRSALSMTAY